jgi:hypothetical protein
MAQQQEEGYPWGSVDHALGLSFPHPLQAPVKQYVLDRCCDYLDNGASSLTADETDEGACWLLRTTRQAVRQAQQHFGGATVGARAA